MVDAYYWSPGALTEDGDQTARLAQEFVNGGEEPAWQALTGQLVELRSGAEKPAADGVVLVRSADPQHGGTASLLDGLSGALFTHRVIEVGIKVYVPGVRLTFWLGGLMTVVAGLVVSRDMLRARGRGHHPSNGLPGHGG